MNGLKEFWVKYRSLFLMFLFCASIIFYLGRKVVVQDSQLVKLQLETIQKDSLLMLSEGKYRKMVNTFATKKDLNAQVKKDNPFLYNEIAKAKEKILSNTGIDFTFKPKDGVTKTVFKDTTYTFTSYYPKRDSSFIKFDGSLNTNTQELSEKWSFSDIKLDVILTQKENGLWNSYLSGPDFIKVNSMKINSLPPKEYVPPTERVRLFNFYGGVGIRSGIDNIGSANGKDLTINGAVTFKNKFMIQGNIGTDKKVGAAVLFKF